MNARSSWMTATLGALLATASAGAQDLEGRFTLAIEAGTDTEIAGDVLESASGTLIGLPVTIDRRSYRDAYRPEIRGQVLLGYGVAADRELVAKGTYYKVDNEGIAAGQAADADLFAFLSEYEEWGVEVAYRFYLASRTRLKSYLGPVAGVRLTHSMLVTFAVPEEGSSISNIPLYEASTVGVFGADIGFSFDLGENAYVGLETGLRYQTKPTQQNAVAGFETIDDDGGRWSAPVVLMLGVRF